jgi:DNA processing protein
MNARQKTNKSSDETRKYWLGVKLVPAFTNRIYKLVEAAGGPKGLWHLNKAGLMQLGFPEHVAVEIVACRKTLDIDSLYEGLRAQDISIITDTDDSYPELLKFIPSRPQAVFVRGALKPFNCAVAIVGSRRATVYGKAMATELATDLARANITVVSGGARGIDSAAHQGALSAGGYTIAVLGCGVEKAYPPENRRLFEEIASSGAIISEYPPKTIPFARNFPARNRIVAGMCQATVVVEANEKSGALITADFALEYGRDVFAVPGYSKSETSRGANKLIKQGAYLVDSAEDILEVLGVEPALYQESSLLTAEERALLEAMGWEIKRLDEIVRETGASIASVSTLLLGLEISGYIKKDVSGCYLRLK